MRILANKAIVITGAPKEHAPLFRQFAQGSFPTATEIDLIQYHRAETAFINEGSRTISSQQCRTMRDIIETRVKRAYNQGARECAIITCTHCNPSDDYFDVCGVFLRNEQRQVLRWGAFKSFALAFFTLDGTLIPLTQLPTLKLL